MSGCLVSRYSIAWLWSEWEALETWEATLAVSYVSLAARVCNTCSLLSIQQSKLRLVNHFSGWHFPLRSLASRGRGVFHCKLSLSAPPIALVNSWTLCALAWWKHSDLLLWYACHPGFITNLNAVGGKKFIVEWQHRNSAEVIVKESESVLQAVGYRLYCHIVYKNQFINLHYCKSQSSLLTILEIWLETLHCSLFYCYSEGLSNVNRWKVLYIGQLF